MTKKLKSQEELQSNEEFEQEMQEATEKLKNRKCAGVLRLNQPQSESEVNQ